MNGSFSHFAVESRKIFDATEQVSVKAICLCQS